MGSSEEAVQKFEEFEKKEANKNKKPKKLKSRSFLIKRKTLKETLAIIDNLESLGTVMDTTFKVDKNHLKICLVGLRGVEAKLELESSTIKEEFIFGMDIKKLFELSRNFSEKLIEFSFNKQGNALTIKEGYSKAVFILKELGDATIKDSFKEEEEKENLLSITNKELDILMEAKDFSKLQDHSFTRLYIGKNKELEPYIDYYSTNTVIIMTSILNNKKKKTEAELIISNNELSKVIKSLSKVSSYTQIDMVKIPDSEKINIEIYTDSYELIFSILLNSKGFELDKFYKETVIDKLNEKESKFPSFISRPNKILDFIKKAQALVSNKNNQSIKFTPTEKYLKMGFKSGIGDEIDCKFPIKDIENFETNKESEFSLILGRDNLKLVLSLMRSYPAKFIFLNPILYIERLDEDNKNKKRTTSSIIMPLTESDIEEQNNEAPF